MAEALGVLPAEALLYLTHETARQMRNLAESAVSRTTARVNEALAKIQPGPDRESVTVTSIRDGSQDPIFGLMPVAAALQALSWAVNPPLPTTGLNRARRDPR